MGSRKIDSLKGRSVLFRLRVLARTQVQSPGWLMAALSAIPPPQPPATNRKIQPLEHPMQRLLVRYRNRNPDERVEWARKVDGTIVNRSWMFVRKQYGFIRKGHSEEEAYDMAKKSMEQDELQALEKVKSVTTEARQKGAVPAISSLKEGDQTWERYEFWREELSKSPYEVWIPAKQAALDNWIARQLLGLELHHLRYLSKEDFSEQVREVRQMVFADVIAPKTEKDKKGGYMDRMSDDDLASVKHDHAVTKYKGWEEKMLEQRAKAWSPDDLAELQKWLEDNHTEILTGVEDPYPAAEGGVIQGERNRARFKVLQYMAFPMLRPELQSLPYLSASLARLFLDIARKEADALRFIIQGPLGRRRADFTTAEAALNDSIPKLVVKIYATVCVARPCAWRVLRYVLRDAAKQCDPKALANLPELQDAKDTQGVLDLLDTRWAHLTDTLTSIALDQDPGTLREDIQFAYQAVNDLHRVAEELIHVRGAGHPLDEELKTELRKYDKLMHQDLIFGEVLRKHDISVTELLPPPPRTSRLDELSYTSPRPSAEVVVDEELNRKSDEREAAREAWEKQTGYIPTAKELFDRVEKEGSVLKKFYPDMIQSAAVEDLDEPLPKDDADEEEDGDILDDDDLMEAESEERGLRKDSFWDRQERLRGEREEGELPVKDKYRAEGTNLRAREDGLGSRTGRADRGRFYKTDNTPKTRRGEGRGKGEGPEQRRDRSHERGPDSWRKGGSDKS